MKMAKTSLLAMVLSCAAAVGYGGAAPAEPVVTASGGGGERLRSWADLLNAEGPASPWLLQVCKLAEAGTDDQVLLAFIDSAGTFSLTWKQIVLLRTIGMPGEIVAAMLSHDTHLSSGLLPPPPAPPGRMSPRIVMVTNAPAPAVSSTTLAEPNGSIVHPSPGLDFCPSSYCRDESSEPADLEEIFPGVIASSVSPVREPYPVPLTSPIRVYRGVSRVPNVQLLEWFP